MNDLATLLSQLRRSFTVTPAVRPSKTVPPQAETSESTVLLDRPLSEEEHLTAEWLLTHGDEEAISFLPQLADARVVGKCSCGCPTVDIRVSDVIRPGQSKNYPVAEAFGRVDGNLVGVMLLQRDGYLTCLEVYELSEIEHPFGFPAVASLEPAVWPNKT